MTSYEEMKKKPFWWKLCPWWLSAKEYWNKTRSEKIKEDDPELDAQKIYDHWL